MGFLLTHISWYTFSAIPSLGEIGLHLFRLVIFPPSKLTYCIRSCRVIYGMVLSKIMFGVVRAEQLHFGTPSDSQGSALIFAFFRVSI